MRLESLAVGLPIYHFQNAIRPIVLNLHCFQQMGCMDGVADGLFKATMDSLAVNVKSNWSCGSEWNDGAVLTVLDTISTRVPIGFNVELGEKWELVEWDLLVLMAFHMLE
jgi:hypothetical protein